MLLVLKGIIRYLERDVINSIKEWRKVFYGLGENESKN
jgi:hypothetical protein